MLDNFREVYDKVLSGYEEDNLMWDVFNHKEFRAFVYEVCKGCLEDTGVKSGYPYDLLD